MRCAKNRFILAIQVAVGHVCVATSLGGWVYSVRLYPGSAIHMPVALQVCVNAFAEPCLLTQVYVTILSTSITVGKQRGVCTSKSEAGCGAPIPAETRDM